MECGDEVLLEKYVPPEEVRATMGGGTANIIPRQTTKASVVSV